MGNHLRSWLPMLLALTANSPLFHGHDTGFAGWRAVVGCRWACSWAPPFLDAAAHNDATVAAMVSRPSRLSRSVTDNTFPGR
ncbi:glutamate-cysteine ligase family protein [Speluncibacter jeojiensis]|uniref:glutamate-cysteine ligase family protein n=1 Tax=Speluncibacter jeojiensis TaxID=2710754 RepID=UPI002FCA5D14